MPELTSPQSVMSNAMNKVLDGTFSATGRQSRCVKGWQKKCGSGMGGLSKWLQIWSAPQRSASCKSGCQPRWLCDYGVPGVTSKGAEGQASRLLLHEQGARSSLAVPSIWRPWNTLIPWAQHLASPTTPLPRSCPLNSIEIVLEILPCHTWSSVTPGWKSVLTPLILKELTGEGIGKGRRDRHEPYKRQKPKGGNVITRDHLSNAMKQCMDNSVILKMQLNSTEEWGQN